MNLISRKCAHWQPNSSISCVENWQRLLRMQQINIRPGSGQPARSIDGNQYPHTHSRRRETVDPADLYRPRANVTMNSTKDLDPSGATTERASYPQEQQQQSLPPVRYQPLPAPPFANDQGSDDGGDDDLPMYIGGDEEEKALFEESVEPIANVSMPKASSHVALPPLRPSSGTAGLTQAVAEKDPTLHNAQQQQEQQIMWGNDGSPSPQMYDWVDQGADAASIPSSPPPTYSPLYFSPVYYYNHVLARLPDDSIPQTRRHTDPKRLLWGRSPLAQVTLSEDLAVTDWDGFETGRG
ncbi:hypothetical protein PG985_015629 [Apiospora marii]|uniref:uncharacterized protein n=1 Tax=Apiospora marii TaxID=335849 RepID=UPI0031309E08